jgi:hypothetical protein
MPVKKDLNIQPANLKTLALGKALSSRGSYKLSLIYLNRIDDFMKYKPILVGEI